MKTTSNSKPARRWYEHGLGLRQKFEPVYKLFRFLPGEEGRRAYAVWLGALREAQMEQTLASFEKVVSALGPESIALDLGANVGDYTAKLAATNAQVHAFEPEPRLYRHLQQRFSDTPNVTLHQAAISTEDGFIKLNLEARDGPNPLELMSHSIVEGSDLTKGGLQVEVESVDLFAFIDRLGKAPALIKMDIEGAEVAILEKLFDENRVHDIGELFVETHERQIPALRDRIVEIHKRVQASSIKNINLLWP